MRRGLRLSPAQAVAIFRDRFGCSPIAHLRAMRLWRAQELPLTTSEPIAEVAAAVGITDPSYFDRLLRRHVGLTPAAFRRTRTLAGDQRPPA